MAHFRFLFVSDQAYRCGYHAAVDPRTHAVLVAEDEPSLERPIERRLAHDGIFLPRPFASQALLPAVEDSLRKDAL